MRRKSPAVGDHSETPTELIARISAEHGSPTVTTTGRHRLPGGDVEAVVTTDPLPGNRSLTRRLAPLAVGATVMLVATTIATIVRPADDSALAAPELSNAIVRTDPTTAERPTPTTQPPAPTTTPAPTTAPAPTTTSKKAAPKPTPEKKPAPASSGDGKQAASGQGWKLVGGDEFNGGKSSTWGEYDGKGHDGNGRRTPDAISVENGSLVIRGDSDGNTGGMAWREGQRFGKWEMRAKFPKGDNQYHPVLILWPTDHDWPEGGEVDFAETTSASDDVSFFLHYSSSNQQKYAKKTIDITQWHNYAVEWVDGRITGYIDGAKWFESTSDETMPPGEMQATIQLDYFPDGGSPQPTEMYVDYMRIYK
jgi:hypothetical protein